MNEMIRALIGAVQSDPALATAYSQRYSRPQRALAVERFESARRSGQLRADVDPEVLVDQLWGACYHRLLLPDQPLDTAFTQALVSNLLRGVRRGPGTLSVRPRGSAGTARRPARRTRRGTPG